MSKLLTTALNLNDTNMNTGTNPDLNKGYCPYMQINSHPDSYKTFTESMLLKEQTTIEENSMIPPNFPNGGLYNAPQVTAPWGSIPVVSTDSNLIHLNLRTANPPPGATEQYVSTNRLGNNYTAKPGIYPYTPVGALNGMYRMDVTKGSDAKQY